MFALVTANLINAAAQLGPDLRALRISRRWAWPGSAWATVISRAYMLVVVLLGVWLIDKKRTRELQLTDGMAPERRTVGLWHVDWRFDPARLRRLLGLGLPAASQVGAEVGVVRARHRAVRHARSDLERVAPDRAQPGRRRVHDSARARLGRRGAGRSRDRRRRSRARIGRRLDGDHARHRVHGRVGPALRADARKT